MLAMCNHQSVEIKAPVEKVFDVVVSEWVKEFEGIHDWQPGSEGRMGDGFQISYILGVETKIELEVKNYAENGGWGATSITGPRTIGE
jgi:hypothetical protein